MVVAIIAVLLTLLTPAVEQAYARALGATCAARHQQMMVGTTSYLMENRLVYFTAPAPQKSTVGVQVTGTSSVQPRGYNGEPAGDWYDLVRPYITPGHGPMPKNVQYSDVFFCPRTSAIPYANNPVYYRLWSDWSINAFLTGRDYWGDGSGFRPYPIKMTQVSPTSRVIVYMESKRGQNPNWDLGAY